MSASDSHLTRYALSGVSCMTAGFVTNPIDVIKVRLQLDNEMAKDKGIFADRYYRGFVRGGLTIIRDEGVLGLYKGVVASVMREGIYSTIRLGSYEPIKELLGASDPSNTSLLKKIAAGAISGAVGSAIANPTDLVKIRMQADRRLKKGEKPRYVSTFHAFKEIAEKEGIRGLWRGVGPTVQRAAILTATQIPSYDHSKHILLNHGWFTEGLPLHITASMIAGFMTAFVTSPVDVMKTRIMNQKVKGNHSYGLKYSSTIDCFVKTLKTEGPLGFYKGFIPNWIRIGPHTIITFLIFEQLRKLVGMRPV